MNTLDLHLRITDKKRKDKFVEKRKNTGSEPTNNMELKL